MTKENLYEAIGEIGERHIKEAMEYRKSAKHTFIKLGTVAACLCIAVLLVPILKKPFTTTYEFSLNVNHIKDYLSYAADIDMISYRELDKEGVTWAKNEFASAIGMEYAEFTSLIPSGYEFSDFSLSRTPYVGNDGTSQMIPHTYFLEYNKESGRVRIGLSSIGKPARCIVIPEENYKLSEIEDVPVLVLTYGDKDDFIAEFEYQNVNYYIDANGISTDELKELLCSIIR